MNKQFKEVVLISTRQADFDFITFLALKLNLKLRTYKNVDTKPEINEDSLIFVDVSSEELFFKYENYTKKINKVCSHFISDQPINKQRYIPKSVSFSGYIQRGKNSIYELAEQYILAIQSPSIEKLNQKPILSKKINFTNTRQKHQAIDQVAKDLRGKSVSERIVSIVLNAVDEIVMNGMFDSQIDQEGQQVYRFTPRTAEFDLADKSSVSLNYSLSEDYILLSAVDNFGSFNREKFYDYIARIKSKKDFSSPEEGAGLGLAQIFLSGGSVFLYCEPGQKTEVFVLFKKTNSLSDFKSQSKFITSSVMVKEAA